MAHDIEKQYDRLARKTVPCPSITFWRTVDGLWGARAGIGEHVIRETAGQAIADAITNGILAFEDSKPKTARDTTASLEN